MADFKKGVLDTTRGHTPSCTPPPHTHSPVPHPSFTPSSSTYVVHLKDKVYLFPLFAGIPVTDAQLEEVAVESGVLDVPDDYLATEFREECERIVDVKHLQPSDCKEAFLFLKQHFRH